MIDTKRSQSKDTVFYHLVPITATHGGNQSARFPFASRYYDTSCSRLCVRWIWTETRPARKSPLNLHQNARRGCDRSLGWTLTLTLTSGGLGFFLELEGKNKEVGERITVILLGPGVSLRESWGRETPLGHPSREFLGKLAFLSI